MKRGTGSALTADADEFGTTRSRRMDAERVKFGMTAGGGAWEAIPNFVDTRRWRASATVDADAPAAANAEAEVAAPAPANVAAPVTPEPAAPAATIWNIVVAKASLRDYTLQVEDRSTTPAAALR